MTDEVAFFLDQSTMTTSKSVQVNCSGSFNESLSCVTELQSPTIHVDSTLNTTLTVTLSCVTESPSDVVQSWVDDIVAVLIAILLSAVIIGTLLGNASVILAVSVYDKMRTLSNMLIASLGLADLLVAIVVMPISLQVRHR